MITPPACPICAMENTYPDSTLMICADCGHEFSMSPETLAESPDEEWVKDANGNRLVDGDSVVLIKDLKVKGSSITLKGGTKIKGIRLVSGDHPIDCKVDKVSFMLKAEFVKKA